MKRSRIFLGLTTTCLAVAGLVAAKATHFNDIKRWYVTDGGNCVCQPGIAPCFYDPFGALTCVTVVFGRAFPLYTQNLFGVFCINPVKYDFLED